MVDAQAFDHVPGQLEESTSLDRIEARGTVRLALKESGLAASGVTPEQMGVVLQKVPPGELDARGIADGAAICERLASDLRSAGIEVQGGDSPEDVFARLGAWRLGDHIQPERSTG